jgi:hypothetical protein
MVRQIEHDYDSSTHNVASASPVEVYSYPFTPQANTKYLVLVSYKFWGSATYNAISTAVRQTSSSGTLLGFTSNPNYNTSEVYGGGTAVGLSYGASPPGTDYIKIFLSSQYATQTAYLSEIRLIIIQVDDSTEMTGSTSCNSNTSTSYIDCLSLGFTPATAGDYLIIGYMTSGSALAGNKAYATLDIDGTDYQEHFVDHGAGGRHPHFFAKKVALTAASHTVKIQHKVDGGTATWCYPKLVAIRLDKFLGNDVTENTTLNSMTGTTYYTVASDTATETSHTSIIIAKACSGGNSSSYYGYWRLYDGSNTINETIIRGSTGGHFPTNFAFVYDEAPSETYYSQVKNSSSGSTYYDEGEIFILDISEVYVYVTMAATTSATSSASGSLSVIRSVSASTAASASVSARLDATELKGRVGATERVFNGDFVVFDAYEPAGWINESVVWAVIWMAGHEYCVRTTHSQASSNALKQDVDLTNVNYITFDLYGSGVGYGSDYEAEIRVYVDNDLVLTATPGDYFTNWWKQTIDVSSYTGTHTIKFYADIDEMFMQELVLDNISALVPVTSVSGTLDLQPALAGAIAATATVEATLTFSIPMEGTTGATSGASAVLDLQPTLIGAVSAQSSVSGAVDPQQGLAGSISATLDTTSDLTVTASPIELVGTVEATTSVGTTMSFVDMIEVWRSVNAGAYVVVAYIPFSDSPYIDYDIVGGSVYCYKLIKYVDQVAVDWSNLDCTAYGATDVPIEGAVAGQSSVSGSLAVETPIIGTLAAQSVVIASTIDVQSGLKGSAIANTSASGILDVPFLGTVSASASLTGILDVQQGLVGSLAATSAVSGSVAVVRDMVSSVSAISSVLGVLDVNQGLISSITCQSTVAGILDAQSALVSTVQAQSVVSGTLLVDIPLIGGIDVLTVVEGSVSIDMGMVGVVDAVAAVTGQFYTLFLDAAYAETDEYARITWWEAV